MEAETIKRKTRQGDKSIALPKKFVPQFWKDSDARISVVKAIKKRVQLIREHAGGHESAQRSLLCDRLAFISIWLESQEVAAGEGREFDPGGYIQSVNCFAGLLKTLGLEKRVKSVADLNSYLAGKRNGK